MVGERINLDKRDKLGEEARGDKRRVVQRWVESLISRWRRRQNIKGRNRNGISVSGIW